MGRGGGGGGKAVGRRVLQGVAESKDLHSLYCPSKLICPSEFLNFKRVYLKHELSNLQFSM